MFVDDFELFKYKNEDKRPNHPNEFFSPISTYIIDWNLNFEKTVLCSTLNERRLFRIWTYFLQTKTKSYNEIHHRKNNTDLKHRKYEVSHWYGL